jgi:hypothetical protein
MSATATGFEFVTLKSGLIVSLEALRLAWALEDRGARFSVDGEDLVVDGPPDFLTDIDRAAIRRWKRHLMAITQYHEAKVLA